MANCTLVRNQRDALDIITLKALNHHFLAEQFWFIDEFQIMHVTMQHIRF